MLVGIVTSDSGEGESVPRLSPTCWWFADDPGHSLARGLSPPSLHLAPRGLSRLEAERGAHGCSFDYVKQGLTIRVQVGEQRRKGRSQVGTFTEKGPKVG